MKEIWKPILNHENRYEVSSKGRVRSLDRHIEKVTKKGVKFLQFRKGRILKTNPDKNGYLFVQLYTDGYAWTVWCHRMVAKTFMTNPNNYSDVNHLDCVKSNNTVENLEWCSHEQNVKHAVENKRFKGRRKKCKTETL